MGIRNVIKQKLVAFQEKKYQAQLCSKKMTYEQWIAPMDQEQTNQEAPQILLLQIGEGVPAAGAEAAIKAYFAKHPEVLIAYGDEDVREPSTGKRTDPWFKPDWSPDTFLSSFYWGSLVAVRKEWLEALGRLAKSGRLTEYDRLAEYGILVGNDRLAEGEARSLAEQASASALMAEIRVLVEEAGGFEKGCKTIGHIPQILFHGVSREQQEKFATWNVAGWLNAEAAGTARRLGTEAAGTARRLGTEASQVNSDSLISVIIPSKDHPDILFRCLQSLFETKGACSCEVIVVDNGSCEENRLQVEQFLQNAPIPCQYFYRPMEFNFSKMCNLGAQEASGELLLFLNDDVEAACSGWLEHMAHKALQPYVGAVGLKLYYPGGKQMQHAGIVNLPGGPIHKLQFMTDDRTHFYGYNKQDRNVLAVTGACLMVHREKYRQAGGMNEELRVTFNDVDLCFHLWKLGYHNVVLNSAYAYHHESLSRGEDKSREKFDRLTAEQEKLYSLHPQLQGHDPYYSAWLNRDAWDTAIRPAYVTAGNRMQEAEFQEFTVDLQQYRRDDCLLFGLEKCEPQCIQGYSVVLGDNNACYDRKLILWKLENQEMLEPEKKEPEKKEQQAQEKKELQAQEKNTQAPEAHEPRGKIRCLSITLEGQYRPDLEENMADQVNVALGGFWLKPCRIPTGVYRMGILADSRVSGIRLVNWSSRLLVIT